MALSRALALSFLKPYSPIASLLGLQMGLCPQVFSSLFFKYQLIPAGDMRWEIAEGTAVFWKHELSKARLSQRLLVVGKIGNQRRRVLIQLLLKLVFPRVRSREQAGKRVTSFVQNVEHEQRGWVPDPAPAPQGTAPVELCWHHETTSASPYLCLTELVMLYNQHKNPQLQHFDFCSPFSSYIFFLNS